MTSFYDSEALSLALRPSVTELRRKYEEMVAKLNSGVFVWTKRPRRDTIRIRPKATPDLPGTLHFTVVQIEDSHRDAFEASNGTVRQFRPLPPVPVKKVSGITIALDVVENEIIASIAPQPVAPEPEVPLTTITTVQDFVAMFERGKVGVSSTIYHIDLSNNSLGNNAFAEATTTITKALEGLNTTFAVKILDLSWNDLEDESIVPFSKLLERFTGLSCIKLDGNPFGAQGLEAILSSMKNSKTKAPSITVSLRETSIGDDGASRLGAFLKDNQLPLTALDLTNSCIFDAVVALALDLHNNTTLQTLVMDDNMIGSQGAFALGEALMVNKQLRNLHVRNCDIAAAGLATLCDGIRMHPALAYLDVSLNPWELAGEMNLLELTWTLPSSHVIKWREGAWDYGEEELTILVGHFSPEAVFDRIISRDGDAYYPIITNAELLKCDLLASTGPSYIVSQLNKKDDDVSYACKAMEVLAELAAIHSSNLAPWLSTIEKYDLLFSSWLSPTHRFFLVGLLHIKLVGFFTAIVRFGNPTINGAILEAIHICAEFFFTYPKRNLYHHAMSELIRVILNTKDMVFRELIRTELAPKLIALIEKNARKEVGTRSCLYGHAILLVPMLEPYIEKKIWIPFERDYIKPYQETVGAVLGGARPPDRPKTTRKGPVMEL